MPKLVEYEGILCVQTDPSPLSTEPVSLSHLYPVGRNGVALRVTPDNRDLIGQEAREYRASFDYQYYLPASSAVYRETPLPLKDGGKTIPVHTIETPLKPPRGGPWRYSYGEWINERTSRRKRA